MLLQVIFVVLAVFLRAGRIGEGENVWLMVFDSSIVVCTFRSLDVLVDLSMSTGPPTPLLSGIVMIVAQDFLLRDPCLNTSTSV